MYKVKKIFANADVHTRCLIDCLAAEAGFGSNSLAGRYRPISVLPEHNPKADGHLEQNLIRIDTCLPASFSSVSDQIKCLESPSNLLEDDLFSTSIYICIGASKGHPFTFR